MIELVALNIVRDCNIEQSLHRQAGGQAPAYIRGRYGHGFEGQLDDASAQGVQMPGKFRRNADGGAWALCDCQISQPGDLFPFMP